MTRVTALAAESRVPERHRMLPDTFEAFEEHYAPRSSAATVAETGRSAASPTTIKRVL